jgi:hypothetical protein
VLKYPSTEITITGNQVNGQHIAGLITMSQQSVNQGHGVITNIDYSTGIIQVASGPAGSTATALLQINDPNGRFGRPQSPDPRFQVDDANPTIHAATGYPMCVPRTDPASADDPLCPQRNRPIDPVTGSYSTLFTMPAPGPTLAPTDPDACLTSGQVSTRLSLGQPAKAGQSWEPIRRLGSHAPDPLPRGRDGLVEIH